jgi:hypothetical protein
MMGDSKTPMLQSLFFNQYRYHLAAKREDARVISVCLRDGKAETPFLRHLPRLTRMGKGYAWDYTC